MRLKIIIKSVRNLPLECPTGPNQPKAQILFHEKSSPKGFIRGTLDIRVGVLFNTKRQFELMLLRSLMVDAYK